MTVALARRWDWEIFLTNEAGIIGAGMLVVVRAVTVLAAAGTKIMVVKISRVVSCCIVLIKNLVITLCEKEWKCSFPA